MNMTKEPFFKHLAFRICSHIIVTQWIKFDGRVAVVTAVYNLSHRFARISVG